MTDVMDSMYTKVPRNLKTDNVLPAISEIPSMITSVRHLRRNRSESVGPQSEADVYETLAVQDRERKASNPLMSRIRQIKKDQISDSNKSWSDRASSNSWMGSLGPVGLPTPAGSQADLYNSSLTTDVFVDAPLTPNSLSSAVGTPNRRLSEDRRQLEKDEKEMFSQVEKPRVRYDVEVITKLIVYTGNALLPRLSIHFTHARQVLHGLQSRVILYSSSSSALDSHPEYANPRKI